MITLTVEEKSILSEFKPLTRFDIITNLKTSLSLYDVTEIAEKNFTESLLVKLQSISDTEFNNINYDNIISFDDINYQTAKKTPLL